MFCYFLLFAYCKRRFVSKNSPTNLTKKILITCTDHSVSSALMTYCRYIFFLNLALSYWLSGLCTLLTHQFIGHLDVILVILIYFICHSCEDSKIFMLK